jgi:hypothetical protein
MNQRQRGGLAEGVPHALLVFSCGPMAPAYDCVLFGGVVVGIQVAGEHQLGSM